MRNIRNKILICLATIAFILNGCQFEERYHIADIFPENDVTNPQANLFLEQLQKQENAQEDFATALSGYQPMYEEVKITTSSDYGYCYFIPYADHEGVICGSIYYIIDAEEQDGDVIALNDCPLDHLENINAERLNNDIPIYSRYVYSASFAALREKGFKVESELTAFADLLSDGRTIPLSWEKSPFKNRIQTKGANDILEIELKYDVTYIGGLTDAVYGMHPDMLKRVIFEVLEELTINNLASSAVKHIPMVGMYVRIPVQLLPTKPDNFVDLFIKQIRNRIFENDFYISIQYSYHVTQSGNEHSGGTGGGRGGNSGNTGNTGNQSGEPINITDASSFKYACRSNATLFNNGYHSAEATTLGVNSYITFEEYQQAIELDPSIEHSTSLIGYPDEEGSITYYLTPVIDGTANSVGNEVSSECLVSTMHNHPNGTPPSAQDLLFTVEQGGKKENYQATFIYDNNTGSYYTLNIVNKRKLSDLYVVLRDNINPNTNDFIPNKDLFNVLSKYDEMYIRCTREERQIYRLAIVIAEYAEENVIIIKHDASDNSNTGYSMRKRKNEKGEVEYYEPIKYQ